MPRDLVPVAGARYTTWIKSLDHTDCFASGIQHDAVDRQSSAEIYCKPRVALFFAVNTARVRLMHYWVAVAVHSFVRRTVLSPISVVVDAGDKSRLVECHIHVQAPVHCIDSVYQLRRKNSRRDPFRKRCYCVLRSFRWHFQTPIQNSCLCSGFLN